MQIKQKRLLKNNQKKTFVTKQIKKNYTKLKDIYIYI